MIVISYVLYDACKLDLFFLWAFSIHPFVHLFLTLTLHIIIVIILEFAIAVVLQPKQVKHQSNGVACLAWRCKLSGSKLM